MQQGKSLREPMYALLLILGICLILVARPVQADVITLFRWTFENGLGLWSIDNGVWEVGAPTATNGPTSCFQGTRCVGTLLAEDYKEHVNSRLISPTILLPRITEDSEIRLQAAQWFSYNRSDAGYVQVSILDEDTHIWSSWTTLTQGVVRDSTVWSLTTVDLSPYAEKKVRIAFYHTASTTRICSSGCCFCDNYTYVSSGWFIDDIRIIIANPDVSGFATGISLQRIVCKNLTTEEEVIILDNSRTWNCEKAGLSVNSGDRIRQTIIGIAN